MDEHLKLNTPQLTSIILNAKNKVDIWGRGTGKSYLVGWDINTVNRLMPRAVIAVTGQTFGQLLTKTLPSTFNFLEELGHVRDETYVIGRRPPKGWESPYEKIMKYDNFISFSNGNGILMLSQDRKGSSRGPNVEYEIVDEALTINKERYDQETSPTNRGHEELWGKQSPNPIPWHHGHHYVSSMPYTAEQKWLLDFGKYYEDEAGIRILDIWNRIIKLQLQLIDAKKDNNKKQFKDIWNETIRLKRKIQPFVSNTGTLFTLANAFDNLDNVGLSYIIREFEKQTLLTFLVEMMNMVLDKIDACYYDIEEDKHIYFNATNDSFIRDYAENTGWDFKKLGTPDCRFDLDCITNLPLDIVFDWGSSISLMSVGQEGSWDYVTRRKKAVDNFINEFYVKPEESKSVMINDLIDEFCKYYEYHQERMVFYYRDRYGDNKLANSARSYNEQAIARLEKNGWRVISKVHRGKEPPQHDKYLLWGNILKAADPKYPNVRFNGNKCKYTLISMNNTQVVEKKGKFEKDKKSEHPGSGVLPEEATHFGDAVDKRIWTKYGQLLLHRSAFVSARYGNK